MADNLDDLLNNLDDAYNAAEASDSGLELPAGDYVFWVKDAEVCKSNSSDRIHVKMECVVVDDSKYKNMSHYSYDLRFTNTDGTPDMRAMGFFKLACQKLGIVPASTAKEAPESVAKMVGRVFHGTIVVKGDFRNLRIKKLVHDNYNKWVEQGCPMDSTGPEQAKGW